MQEQFTPPPEHEQVGGNSRNLQQRPGPSCGNGQSTAFPVHVGAAQTLRAVGVNSESTDVKVLPSKGSVSRRIANFIGILFGNTDYTEADERAAVRRQLATHGIESFDEVASAETARSAALTQH